MRDGGLRVVTALVLIGLVTFLTGGAYAAGYAEGANHVGTVSPWVYGGFGASHLVGFLVGIFVLIVILRLVFFGSAWRRHGPWGYRHYGRWGYGPGAWGNGGPGNTQPGDWQQGPWQDPAKAMFDDYHRQAHQGSASGQPGQPGQPSNPNDPNQPR